MNKNPKCEIIKRKRFCWPGRRNQCRTETFIVAISYLILTAAFIHLLSGTVKTTNMVAQQLKSFISLVIVVGVSCLLMSFTKEKLGHYPIMDTANTFLPTGLPIVFVLIFVCGYLGRATKQRAETMD